MIIGEQRKVSGMNRTKINWVSKPGVTGYTWNPVTGCPLPLISSGCKNCYSRRLCEGRLRGRAGYPQDDPFQIVCHEKRLNEPLKMKKPARIFVGSMGDMFHKEVSGEYIKRIYDIMKKASQHTYMILSKRYSRILRYKMKKKDIPNVYYGVSLCDKKDIERYTEAFYHFPNHSDFTSFEPIIEDIREEAMWMCRTNDWIIVGGESGVNARPFDWDWAREIRDACKEHGTPFFPKQGSGTGKQLHDIPADLRIREYPEW